MPTLTISNHFRLCWLFQPQDQAKPNQTEGKKRAKEEKGSGYLLAAKENKADKARQSGCQW